jgi:carbon starvation protein
MKKLLKRLVWMMVVLIGSVAVAGIALHRGEHINSLWFIAAALCVYAVSYRFYAAFIATKVLVVDSSRILPAERLNNGRDFIPTNKWVVFGHHFAAIAGPGPLIGPTLAAQFGYLPGTLWILFGAVLGGCVQDMVTLFISARRDGKSLGLIARQELGVLGGTAALIGTFVIMIILIAVLGLVVVNAMKHSPWATFTVSATIPIAMITGLYMSHFRPGRVLEASCVGVLLLVGSVIAGNWINEQEQVRYWFHYDGLSLAWFVMIYGFMAAILPVWLLLAPRDYLSTFVKLGTIMLLALAIIILRPDVHMPALTPFIDGSGPIFGGQLFPFVFITIACGAISGFHALIASGTTPKLLMNEADIPMIGYGAMLLESSVALMAMLAATVLEPGVFFAINTPIATNLTHALPEMYQVSSVQMAALAHDMGEASLYARTGGAPSFAVGMASIFGGAFGHRLLALWYHFAIMFEAIFILTTLDAGTRVGRFMLQDILGRFWPKMGHTSAMPSVILTSALVVMSWGYFLYIGVIDPNGGVNILWPIFGIANQMLAGIALSIATVTIVKSNKLKYIWVTALPLLWLLIVTSSAAWQKIYSSDIRIGFLAAADDMSRQLAAGLLSPEKAIIAPQLIFNLHLDVGLMIFLVMLLWLIVFDACRTSYQYWFDKDRLSVVESNHLSSIIG